MLLLPTKYEVFFNSIQIDTDDDRQLAGARRRSSTQSELAHEHLSL
jgi:hypothetical protein